LIRSWAKILPYWVISFLVRRFTGDVRDLWGHKVVCRQICDGEYIVVTLDKDTDDESKFEAKEYRRNNKKFSKILKKIENNPTLREKFEEHFKLGELRRKEESEYGDY